MNKQFRLTSKSQVTVPLDVRMALGVAPGGAVVFDRDGDKVVIRKADDATMDGAARRADRIARLNRARTFARAMDMTTDDYMAMIREPLPTPAE